MWVAPMTVKENKYIELDGNPSSVIDYKWGTACGLTTFSHYIGKL